MQLLIDPCEARTVGMQLIIPRFYDRLYNVELICRERSWTALLCVAYLELLYAKQPMQYSAVHEGYVEKKGIAQ